MLRDGYDVFVTVVYYRAAVLHLHVVMSACIKSYMCYDLILLEV